MYELWFKGAITGDMLFIIGRSDDLTGLLTQARSHRDKPYYWGWYLMRASDDVIVAESRP